MLGRRSDENNLFEPSPPLEPLDPSERNNFLGTQEAKEEPKKQTMNTKEPSAVIGSKIRFKGELFGEEDLLIQGEVEGTIELKNHSLIIGEQGVVKANITAKTINIQGRVEGDIHGKEKVSIHQSSNVQGNIKASRVVLEDGAKFRGSIDMDIDDNNKGKSVATKPPTTENKATHTPDKGGETH